MWHCQVKKNAFHILLVNEILVTINKKYVNLTHLLVIAVAPTLEQQPCAPQRRRKHHNLTLQPQEDENEKDIDIPISFFLNKSKKNKKRNDFFKMLFDKPRLINFVG